MVSKFSADFKIYDSLFLVQKSMFQTVIYFSWFDSISIR